MIEFLLHNQIIALNSYNLKLAAGIDSLIKRAITREEFSDFYALDALAPYLERGDSDVVKNLAPEVKGRIGEILAKRNMLIWKIANYYYTSMRRIMSDEVLGGLEDSSRPCEQDKISKLDAANIKRDSFGYIQDVGTFTPEQFIVAFENLKFKSSWGGKPWAGIARLYKELHDLIKSLKSYTGDHQVVRWHLDGTFKSRLHQLTSIIDSINQAEHNSGSLFTHFQDSESSWITDALNEKAIPNSLQRLRTRVSPDIKPMVEELDQAGNVDETEIAIQIAEVRLSKWQRKRKQNIIDKEKDAEKDAKEQAEKYHDNEWLEREVENIHDETKKNLARIDYPDGNYDMKVFVSDNIGGADNNNAIFGLFLKNKYYYSLLELVREKNLYLISADLLRKAFQVFHDRIDLKQSVVKNLFNNAKVDMKSDAIDVVSLFYNIFIHIDIEDASAKYGEATVLTVMQMFATSGLNIEPFKQDMQELQDINHRRRSYDPYYTQRPVRREKGKQQLSLFTSHRFERLKKLNKLF